MLRLSNERKCHECGGRGHIRIECANLKKSKGKGKAFNVTQSDKFNDENFEEEV
jgi:RecJ-like exonuclease